MRKIIITAIMALALSACGTTAGISKGDAERPIVKGMSRIIVKRDSSLLYLAASADVSANGAKIGALAPGGEALKDVPAGQVTLTVTTFGSFGSYSTRLDAAPGKTYRFVVGPRDGNLPLVAAFGLVGDAVNSSGNEQAGYFQIKEVR